MLLASAHKDSFARDHLPPTDQWPILQFDLPELRYPESVNCGRVLLDDALREGAGERPAIYWREEVVTYAQLAGRANRIARVLTEDFGVVPGNRVLLRGANTPVMFACWLAVVRVGAVAVTTMPLLRATELRRIIHKTRPSLALCAEELVGELLEARTENDNAQTILTYGGADSELERRARDKSTEFEPLGTSQDDVCLIAFTSGTTSEPKATVHFHRDVLAMCDTFSRHILRPGPDAIFAGTPPIGFTFGLGALLAFPLRARAAVALLDQNTPDALWQTTQRHRATHLFTSPTGYRATLARAPIEALRSVRVCVSAGEHLPKSVSDAWFDATGIRLIDGLGSTEMMHVFLSARPEETRPGAVGRPVPGFTVCLLDEAGRPIMGAGEGRLAVRGPTGCRYLSDSRQCVYVTDGWNITGDIFRRDDDGYYWFVARSDDMIVSAGYNISGSEVEDALLLHPAVKACAVIGWPSEERGWIVKAVIVVNPGVTTGPVLVEALQNHVKSVLAPYKYPRLIEFREQLPITATGKLQRSALRAECTSG